MKAPSRVLLIDDDELILAMLGKALRQEGYDVHAESTCLDAPKMIRSVAPDIILLDIRLPDCSGIDILQELTDKGIHTPVVMLTADESAESAVRAMKLGAVDYLTKPFNIDEIKIVLRNILEKERLRQEVDYLRMVSAEAFEQDIIGQSASIRAVKAQVEKLAAAAVSTFLITGESGTGKELVARYAHRLLHSNGSAGYAPYVRVNCAALPETLLESELFGYEKGSFTDAKADKKGLFELAQGGSILLDEIGEMKQTLQSKLLRVLEERTVRRVGGNQEIAISATVIATTNRNLAEAVEEGEFRKDLFYRLNAFSLRIPPLRERREDIPFLANHFLAHFAVRYNKKERKTFSPEAEALIVAHDWPGNIRELRNVIERIVVLGGEDVIRPEHLPKEIVRCEALAAQQQAGFVLPPDGISLDEVEKNLIRQALERTNHNKAQAAKLLHVSYDTLRYQVKKYHLE